MALSRKAIKELRRVQEMARKQVEGKPVIKGYELNMGTYVDFAPATKDKTEGYIKEGFCATAGCIAGTIVLNSDYQPQDRYGDQWQRTKKSVPLSAHDAAAEILGIDDDAADDLFLAGGGTWDGLDFDDPADIVTAIDRFIANGGEAIEHDPDYDE